MSTPAGDAAETQAEVKASRVVLREHLRTAIEALERGDYETLGQTLNTIGAPRNRRLLESVARIARHVGDTVGELNRDGRLTELAASEIPDARSRLDYVVKMTEEAAHKTLDLVDDSCLKLKQLAELPLVEEAAPLLGELRKNLSSLAQAQEYQDLSGQVIHRVISLVHEIESALNGLLGIAGIDLKFTPRAPKQKENQRQQDLLPGPAVPDVGIPAANQQDADSLMADLGI